IEYSGAPLAVFKLNTAMKMFVMTSLFTCLFFVFADDVGNNHTFSSLVHFHKFKRSDEISPSLNGKTFKKSEDKIFIKHN
ncbi:MAG: NADH-quinone oxidoreductase subunit H, partial [Treponema sp.]|nr:NADH-quinone oxidoreductase subunit H [Treponema sp.]